MRKFILVVAATLFAFTACTQGSSTPATDRPIRLGFEGGLCQAAIPVAHLMGFFESEGIDTEIVVTGDLVSSRDSLVAGHIDTVAGMLSGWFVPATQGMDIQFTLGLHTGCASAFVLSDSVINSFEAGQNIAVSGAIGGAFHNIGLRFIYSDGFMPGDFTWRDFPAAEAVIALQNGIVEIAVIPDQVGQLFADEGLLRRIRSLDDADFENEVCCVLGLTGGFINQYPELAEGITRAVYNASRWMNESAANKAQAISLLIDHGYVSASVDVDFIVGLMSNWEWGISHDVTYDTLTRSLAEYQSIGVVNPNLDLDFVVGQLWNPLG